MSYTLSEKEKQAIHEAADKEFYVDKDGTIELYADYHDTNKFLLETAYDHREDAVEQAAKANTNGAGEVAPTEETNPLLAVLEDKILELHEGNSDIWDAQMSIVTHAMDSLHLDKDNFEIHSAMLDYVQETFSICPPYDHYLDQLMKVNILLGTKEEANVDHSLIHDQYLAMSCPMDLSDSSPEAIKELLETPSGLTRLVEQQGFTMDELKTTLQDYNAVFNADTLADYARSQYPEMWDGEGHEMPLKNRLAAFNRDHSPFLTSLAQELDSQTGSLGVMTVLAEMSMKDYAKLMNPNSEVTMPSTAYIGIFDPESGGGSALEVEPVKPITFTRSDIFDIQIEGAKPDRGWTVNDTFGLVSSCWKAPLSIREKTIEEPQRKPSLTDILKDASSRSQQTKNTAGTSHEQGR